MTVSFIFFTALTVKFGSVPKSVYPMLSAVETWSGPFDAWRLRTSKTTLHVTSDNHGFRSFLFSKKYACDTCVWHAKFDQEVNFEIVFVFCFSNNTS